MSRLSSSPYYRLLSVVVFCLWSQTVRGRPLLHVSLWQNGRSIWSQGGIHGDRPAWGWSLDRRVEITGRHWLALIQRDRHWTPASDYTAATSNTVQICKHTERSSHCSILTYFYRLLHWNVQNHHHHYHPYEQLMRTACVARWEGNRASERSI